jgi:hypothetical protein
MAEIKSTDHTVQTAPNLAQRAKRAGLYLLFGAILFIPRIRRLRRKVWAWTLVRLAAAITGVWLIWRYAHLKAGSEAMGVGLVMLAFALLGRARGVEKSVDEIASGLRSLIVLNGGAFVESPGAKEVPGCLLFVNSKEVIVRDARHRPVASVELAKLRSLAARPSKPQRGRKHPSWEVEIGWDADGARVSRFVYDGPFSEHLAQVMESTLRGLWKKELPILQ